MQFRSLSAAAAVGLLAAASSANAVIVYSGPVNIPIPDNIDGIYMNLVTGAVGTTTPPSGWDINPYSAVAGMFNLWGATTTTWFSAGGVIAGPYPLAVGTTISGAASAFFRPGGGTNVGDQVTLNAPNYFGVRFTNEAVGGINFGWVEITFGAGAGQRAITAYAYETTVGTSIQAGVVPEPGTYALMLAGLAAVGGLAARRRKA